MIEVPRELSDDPLLPGPITETRHVRILPSRRLMCPAFLAGFCVAALADKSFAQDASSKLKADPPQSSQPVKAPRGAGGSGTARAGDDIGQMNPEATARSFPKRGFSPYAGRHYPTRVYWGDEHVHTGWSVDAGAFGCTLGPEEALRFARGEEVKSSLGEPAKLSRPLDWMALTDHSDAAGHDLRDP